MENISKNNQVDSRITRMEEHYLSANCMPHIHIRYLLRINACIVLIYLITLRLLLAGNIASIMPNKCATFAI